MNIKTIFPPHTDLLFLTRMMDYCKISYTSGQVKYNKSDMSREEQNRISYYIACIGAFAEKYSISNAFAYNYLSKYRGWIYQ